MIRLKSVVLCSCLIYESVVVIFQFQAKFTSGLIELAEKYKSKGNSLLN